MAVDVTIFVRKRCELEMEVSRRWAVVFENVANLLLGASEVLHIGP